MSSQLQVTPHPPPGYNGTILSMVSLPRVIEACTILSAKTEESIGVMQNKCLDKAQQCIDAVNLLDDVVLKRDDIEILKADLAAMSNKVDTVATDVAILHTSLENFKTEVLAMLTSSGPSLQANANDSVDSVHDEQGSSAGKVLFLTVKHDGVDQNMYLTRSARDALLGCRIKREAIRRVLLNFNSIKELRQFSLTGGSSRSFKKGQLPPLHAKFAEAAVIKLFPPNPKLKEIINDDGSTKYDEDIKALKADVRVKITSILEYFFKGYDADGNIIPEKKSLKRKIVEPGECDDNQEDLAVVQP